MSEFLAESYENLDQMERDLVLLEKEPSNSEIIARIFRAIHTVKGTSGFLGLNKLETISHTGENLLSRLRDGHQAVTSEIISTLLSLMDALRTILNHVETSKTEGDEDYSGLIENLKKLQSTTAPIEPAKPQISDVELPKKVEEKPIEKMALKPVESEKEMSPTIPDHVAAKDESLASPSTSIDATVRVNVSLLDKLMNLVGELVLARNQILQFTGSQADTVFLRTSQRLNLITSELQEGIMKTRMQPINNIWSKLPRIVRDLAQACGKEVLVEMEGKETELDKTLIESIKDPLTHLVRNAVDHGIESPDQRIAQGKTPEGHLTLKAFHESGQVNIEISDDGAGLNVERIKAKALQKNLMSTEKISKLSDRELIQLIYMPGFSTAEKVTNVSGRGVGLDVVKTNIEKIGGTIDIQSPAGKGTTFKIKIPLTLAIIPALIVSCGGDSYAIPQVSLLELVKIENEEAEKGVEWVQGSPVYRLRGHLLPLIYLRNELKLVPEAKSEDRNKALNIVVLQASDHPFGLVVDDINDSEEIVVKPMGKQLKSIQGFSGATIMGDGRVALILDVTGLAQRAGVLTRHQENTSSEKHLNAEKEIRTNTMLLFGGPNNARMAIPLSMVARLEEFPFSAIETTSGKNVVQYRGHIMPLLNVFGSSPFDNGEGEKKDVFHVVVYSNKEKSIGLVVNKILDIVEADVELQKVSDRSGILGSTIVQQRTTDILDINSIIQEADPLFFTNESTSVIAA